jgi:hypothetical protein
MTLATPPHVAKRSLNSKIYMDCHKQKHRVEKSKSVASKS